MDDRDIKIIETGNITINIFHNVVSLSNLLLAWKKFKKGKSTKKDVASFEFNLENNLFNLHNELINKIYSPDPYQAFFVYDPKKRHIHKACVRDRVIHQAVFQVLYPIFNKHFIFDSYSSRIRKGTHKGSKRFFILSRKVSKNWRKTTFILKCDVQKFFDSIDHQILFDLIKKKILDEDVLWLVGKILKSFEKSPNIGIPLGNVTSQLFANIYLNEFDQFIKHKLKIKFYVRYVDDFVIVSKDNEYLEFLIPKIALFLKNELNLHLHPKKVEIRKLSQGIDFLGYVVFPYYKILRTSTKRRIFIRLKNKVSNETIQSYKGVLSHCSGYKISKVLEKYKR